MTSLAVAVPGLYLTALAVAMYCGLAAWFERIPRHVIAIHATLICLILGPHLFLGRTLLPVSNLRGCSVFSFVADTSATENPLHDDLLVQQLPTTSALRAALARGELPLRDDSVAGGVPLWADQQAQVLQPLMLASLVLPPERALVVLGALRLLLALSFSFLLFRSECGSVTGALAGSIAFGLGGFVQLWLGWPLASSAAWLPVLLWGIRRVLDSGRRRDAALLVLATFGLLTAGHPETVVYAFAFCLAYALLKLVSVPASSRKRVTFTIVAPLVIGAAMTAPVSIPSLRAIAMSERSIVTKYEEKLREKAGRLPQPQPERVIAIVAPEAYGNDRFGKYWGNSNVNEDASGYAGVAAILLCLLLLARRPVDRVIVFLFATLLLCILVIWAAGPFTWIVHHAPVLSSSSTRGHRLLLLISLIVAWLAAIAVARSEVRPTGRAFLFVVASTLGIWLVAIYSSVTPDDLPAAVESRRMAMLVAQLAAIAITAVAMALRSRRVAGALIVATIAIELAAAHMPATPPARAQLPPAPPLLAALRERAAGWRVHASRSALRPNLGSLYGIRQVELYNPIAPASWFVLAVDFSRADESESTRRNADAWLDALGVRYTLRSRGESGSSPNIAVADDRSVVVERASALPLFRFADGVSAPIEGSLVDLLYLPTSEIGPAIAGQAAERFGNKVSWLLVDPPRADRTFVADPGFWSAEWKPIRGDAITLLDRSSARLSFRVRSRGPRLLTTTEVDDGGWTARVDGSEVAIDRVNGALVGVRVPAGTSRVELRYLPPGFAAGMAIGLLAILALPVVLVRWPLK